MKKGRHVLKHAECAFRLLLWSSWFIIGIIAVQILISKEHPVAGEAEFPDHILMSVTVRG